MTGPGTGVDPDVTKLVRRRDPDTSWHAASAQTEGKRAELQRAIYHTLIAHGPLTHEQLVELQPSATPSGVRSRCAELVTAGWVVDSGARRRTRAGGPAIVWRAVEDPEDDAPVPEPDDGWTRPVERRLEAARARAEWEYADPSIADVILRAYLNPDRDGRELDAEAGR